MPDTKKTFSKVKPGLHPRNKHRERYDFDLLIKDSPDLATYVRLNEYQDQSIDFFDPEAVISLNQALLKTYYHIDFWQIPPGYLCPPIPGRADYIHHVADLLYDPAKITILPGRQIRCLDIGVGASCIYPIIGVQEYGWSFVGTDIDALAIASSKQIIDSNPALNDKVTLRLQTNPNKIFYGIIQPEEFFDVTICNPPFHASQAEALAGSVRKLQNLKRKKITQPILNFGGQKNELWCVGGEEKFVSKMIFESKACSTRCRWFTALISKEKSLHHIYKTLKSVSAIEVKTIPMIQGNKSSRIVAWTFIS